jgi:hypothetical protein
MRLSVGLVCAGLLLSTAGIGNAEAPVNEMLKEYDNAAPGSSVRTTMETFFLVTENGFGWANSDLVTRRNEPPLYCVPEKFLFTGSQILDMLRRGAKEDEIVANAPYGFGILLVMEKTFPCNK